jgi:2-polyprenyl-3-methyl-5-hydroxy-6-metoxy-1,4-benzoquinol methylase
MIIPTALSADSSANQCVHSLIDLQLNRGSMADQVDNSDADSALGEDVDHESTTSVLEVPQFTENGRTYHGQGYPLPNDELEKERLDFQHKIFYITFDRKLFTCPVEKLDRVLDVGTGTGIWSMNFGDAHPEAAVLGIDSNWMTLKKM